MSPAGMGAGAALSRVILTNWPIKLTALVLAAVLWAVVEARQPTSQLVPVRIDLVLPDGYALSEPLPAIRALYAGPASELIKLYATPPVIHREITDSVAVLDLTLGELSIPRDIEAGPQDIQPRRLPVRLRRTSPAPAPPQPQAEAPAERVVMGVPITLPSRLRGFDVEPPAVAVTVRGPASRLAGLSRDSLLVTVPDAAVAAGTAVRATAVAPPGLSATVRPDTVRIVERRRG